MTTLYPWTRFMFPFATAFDAAGVTLPGARLYFFASGTATPLDTYSDADRTIPNTNPVVADQSGVFANIFLQDAEYKVVLKDSDEVEYWTADPVAPFLDTDATVTSYYDLPVYIQGKPTVGETFPVFNVVRDERLPSGLTDSIFSVATLPTATATFVLYKNGVVIGTIAFATTGTPAVTFLTDVNFAAGDQFSMTAPNPQDLTGAFFAFTFVFRVL